MIRTFGQDMIDQAARMREDAKQRLAYITADDQISETYRTERLSAVRAETNDELRSLEDRYRVDLEAEVDRLRRKLSTPNVMAYGVERVASDASFRDAMERARRTPDTDDSLMQLYSDARTVSDSLQQRAAMVVAIERHRIDVLNAWVADYPTTEDDVQRLLDLSEAGSALKASVALSFHFSGL